MDFCLAGSFNSIDSGITFSGYNTVDGVTCAVDPAIIPLGTWLRITFLDGEVIYRRAEDTGSAVIGNVVDIYSNQSTENLLEKGRVVAQVEW